MALKADINQYRGMHQTIGSIRVMVLWAAGLGAAVQFSKLSLFLPELELIYPNAESTLGLLVSVISLVGVLFGLIAGTLATNFVATPVSNCWLGTRRYSFFCSIISTITSSLFIQ